MKTKSEIDTAIKFLPRTEFLLIRCKKIEIALIEWCKEKKYSQGDDYYVGINKQGKWFVGYTNDYPLQHGEGKEYILTEQEFKEATQPYI